MRRQRSAEATECSTHLSRPKGNGEHPEPGLGLTLAVDRQNLH